MTCNWRLIVIGALTAALSGCANQPRVAPAPSTEHPAPSTEHPAPSTEHPAPSTEHPAPFFGVLRVQVREGASLVVREVPVEEYVAATILSEFDPPSGDERTIERMFEVQAIVSRSYAIAERGRHAREGFDLCSTSHCQVYEPGRLRTSRWADLARRATERTRGQTLSYGGAPAETLFHADCGGHTSSAAAVWGGTPLPYLVGVRDAADHPHDEWTFAVDAASLRDALDADPRTSVGAQLKTIQVSQRDSAGRAEEVTVEGRRAVTIRGEVFREVISHRFGVKSLRSTLFHISRARTGTKFVFRGKGFGHGVGLCQDGALARLAAGATPKEVLAHYFPGTSLSDAVNQEPE